MGRFRSDANRKTGESRMAPCPFCRQSVDSFPACVQYDSLTVSVSDMRNTVKKHLFYSKCEPIIVRKIYDPLRCVLGYQIHASRFDNTAFRTMQTINCNSNHVTSPKQICTRSNFTTVAWQSRMECNQDLIPQSDR